jgi:hypothetical protein
MILDAAETVSGSIELYTEIRKIYQSENGGGSKN